ncbi:hypothetical protein OIDMADRAFT_139272, partial [Oidiodendron maius Zn]
NYRINLIEPNNLGFRLLYYITIKELEEVKYYLIKNLYKGFIEPSQAPFTILILFVYKANRYLYLGYILWVRYLVGFLGT